MFDELVGMTPGVGGRFNMLRPEAMEACFYLWRVTGKQMYRDWAWAVFKAFGQSCKARPLAVSCATWQLQPSVRLLRHIFVAQAPGCYLMRKPAECTSCGQSCMCLRRIGADLHSP